MQAGNVQAGDYRHKRCGGGLPKLGGFLATQRGAHAHRPPPLSTAC
jgi:hypothetical protein